MRPIVTTKRLAVGASALLAAALAFEPSAVQAQTPQAQTPQAQTPQAQSPQAQSPQAMVIVLSQPCPATGPCAAQAPVLAEMATLGAQVTGTTNLVDTIDAVLTPAQAQTITSLPAVAQVVPNGPIPLGSPVGHPHGHQPLPGSSSPGPRPPAHGFPQPQACGTEHNPLLTPEALQNIDALPALSSGVNGSGVTVAFLADGIDTANPDLLRNPAYGQGGAPVITNYSDFSGDGTSAPTDGAEAFGDASSIAAQGNVAYNLSQYVNPLQAARLPGNGCWVKIVGAAPGANLMALKVFAQNNDTTASGFLQAIQYAVGNGAKVINESFGSPNVPDTTDDLIRDANDAAVAAGVTVVVSSGDAGVTNTIGSPASDPMVISVGATTTFQASAQDDSGGFYNPAVGNGKWLDNNISSLSSGGFTQAGNTVSLVAPGESNWALCSQDTTTYLGCSDFFGGTPIGVQEFGGTSEASPLTAAAAADVIEAYAKAHGGTDPTPALVKTILTSSARDIYAPADEQGAGLLDISAAVKLAMSVPGPTGPQAGAPNNRGGNPKEGPHQLPGSGLEISPGQVNFSGAPGTAVQQQLTVTNTGAAPAVLNLSTRQISSKLWDSGAQTFVMGPSNPTTNSGVFPIWSGIDEVYQTENFTVPRTPGNGPTHLVFSSDYQDQGQNSVLHVALFAPDGTYAAYTEPQGLADYAQAEVNNPMPGTWTALFFTEQDGATPGGVGTSGPVQWDASLYGYSANGTLSPSALELAPGASATVNYSTTIPATAGDSALSIVVGSGQYQTTVPVTIRSTVVLGPQGGTFHGVLTGGNGRASMWAQMDTYAFDVPAGHRDLDVSVAMTTDPGEELIGYLVDPNGQTVGYSSNYTLVPGATGLQPGSTQFLQLYHAGPIPGEWHLILEWENPVTGNELSEPFLGAVNFDQVSVQGALPDSARTVLAQGETSDYQIVVQNTGVAPEAFFADPRLNKTTDIQLANQNPTIDTTNFTLPLAAGLTFPYYIVPTHTTGLTATATAVQPSAPVTFDMEYFPGDPDVSPAQASPNTSASVTADSSLLGLQQTPEVSPGLWLVNPDEVGPYPASGAPTVQANLSVGAVTQAFDPDMSTSTDDFWQLGFSASNFLYLLPGQTGTITVHITPSASPGTVVSGTVFVDDYTLASLFAAPLPDADEMAGLSYSYTVGAAGSTKPTS
ncbi:MAG TPA: S8 family serine peptidase [Acidimicrobiales bacterium]|nr:S8 family serine peptidase [Acidimicrobiales bacterium]